MDQFLFLCLVLTGFLLRVDSQGLPQGQFQAINPGLIYFEDNRPAQSNLVNQQNRPNVVQPANGAQMPKDTLSAGQLPIDRQNAAQQPINGVFVAQMPVDVNAAQLSANVPGVIQVPIKEYHFAPAPVYDPNGIYDRNSDDDINVSKIKNKVRLDKTSLALTNFSVNIMRNVNVLHKQGNTVLSPYSIATLLALLQQGATEQTLEQISGVLHMSLEESANTYRAQTQDIKSRSSRNILRTANNIFIAEAFSLNPQFKIVAQRDFDSGVTLSAFGRPVQAAQQINGWIAEKTNNKINNLIAPESLAENTQMVLVNAVYFKGIWEIPFRPQLTKPEDFQLRNGRKKSVPFMMTRKHFRAGLDSETGSKVIVLPFEREEYLMMIILPSTLSNADDTITSLTAHRLENYLNMEPMEVVLKLPKFTIRSDTDLAPVLRQMGVTKIFEQGSGLSGLGMFRTFTPQVSSAVHSAILTIDEQGGSAAAASAFAVVALSNDEPSMYMKVDRPFVALLWDGKTKAPLFMAKIEDPIL